MIKLLFALLLLLVNLACRAPVTVGARSEDDFVQSVARFPYTAESARRQKILAGYSKLRVGITKSEVAALLGEPDYGKLTYRAKFSDPDGSLWEYHLYKSAKLWTNEVKDRLVYAFFDEDGKIYWIEPKNIDGLAHIGQPVRE